MIGGVGLSKIDWHAGTGGGGISISNGYQGFGHGREAFKAKICFAFCELGLRAENTTTAGTSSPPPTPGGRPRRIADPQAGHSNAGS